MCVRKEKAFQVEHAENRTTFSGSKKTSLRGSLHNLGTWNESRGSTLSKLSKNNHKVARLPDESRIGGGGNTNIFFVLCRMLPISNL